MPPAISVENLSKQYRLGQVGTGTLSHDLNRLWARVRGKPDPYAKVGGINDRESTEGGSQKDYVWALKDVNFTVEPGEIVGIIGKNGAGKSTLLKLLSRVTAPTTGSIELQGRVASLLEVGTGFHPELTGRENIFLNGAILGMTKAEIKARFDDIVDFSGCARYVDTPVKRYSSGMYVRLAFAVAAHLDPEILIVDEVLAVGDAEFQNRCIGKMREVSRDRGRTVLFVSHNMGSIRSLCSRSILMEKGSIAFDGSTASVIEGYLNSQTAGVGDNTETALPSCGELSLLELRLECDGKPAGAVISSEQQISVAIRYRLRSPVRGLRVTVTVNSLSGDTVLMSSDYSFWPDNGVRDPGDYVSMCHFPASFFNSHDYRIGIAFDIPRQRELLPLFFIPLKISELSIDQMGYSLTGRPVGLLHPVLRWDVNRVSPE